MFVESIAEIFNQIASDGDCPKEINHGILVPLQKPGKPRGPASKLKPIILLSTLRKILAVCIMDGVGSRLDHKTPITQPAHRKERSTTEHVFEAKMVIERTTNVRNETLHLVVFNMSKAFDSIKRKDVIEHLQHTIEADELHIMKKMLEMSLVVRCGDSINEPFHIDTSVPQGDCASANSFTYYLAKSLEVQTPDAIIHGHHYHYQSITSHEIPDELTKHNYAQPTQIQHFNTEKEYADDLSKLTSDYNNIHRYKHNAEEILGKKGLKVKKSKTENYIISRQNHHQWKKCKLLGKLLDTNEDIKGRKILAINAANNLCRFFENDNLTINLKLKLINTHIEPVFLYNSETWTLTKSMEESINAFQRRIIRRYCFNIKWPKTLSNRDLYERTKIVE